MRWTLVWLLVLVAGSTMLTASCQQPGSKIVPVESDFAFLDLKLYG